jgi:hypothetical protein
MRGRPRSMVMAAALAAMAGPAFVGAQRIPKPGEDVRPMAFDPLAMLRRPPRKQRQSRNWVKPHCGAKQARSYLRQAVTHNINQHYDARMRWNETTYPRVLEHQRKQRERSFR